MTVVRGDGLVLEDVDAAPPFVATLAPGSRGTDAARAGRAAARSVAAADRGAAE